MSSSWLKMSFNHFILVIGANQFNIIKVFTQVEAFYWIVTRACHSCFYFFAVDNIWIRIWNSFFAFVSHKVERKTEDLKKTEEPKQRKWSWRISKRWSPTSGLWRRTPAGTICFSFWRRNNKHETVIIRRPQEEVNQLKKLPILLSDIVFDPHQSMCQNFTWNKVSIERINLCMCLSLQSVIITH